jgi:hypothetical protein
MAIDSWEFVGDATTVVDGVLSPVPPRTLGETITYRLRFAPNNRPTSHTDRYLAVRAYERYAGRASWGATHEGAVWYQERLPSGAPVNSNVVQIAPASTPPSDVFEGVWGLIEDIEEVENRLPNRLVLDVGLVYLGDADEYADRSAVESALGTSPV